MNLTITYMYNIRNQLNITLFHQANNIVSEEEDTTTGNSPHQTSPQSQWIQSCVLKMPEQRKKEDSTSSQTSKAKDQHNIFISLPYIKGTLEKLQRILKKYGISSYFKPFHSIRQLLAHPKDKTEIMKQSGVI